MEKSNVKKLTLFAITWPIFIESMLHMMLRTADTFMLSKVSDEAVAAVGVANQIVMFMFFLFNFVSVGAAVVIAQYLGAKKYGEIHKFSANAISLNFLFGIIISIVITVFSTPYLNLFNLEPELFSEAKIYMLIVGGALFLQALMLTVSAIIQAHGHTKYTMYVSVGMNVLNITGNYLFIFGALGFPQLGVTGVAISTVVSQFLGLIVNFLILFKKVNIQISLKELVTWQKHRVKQLLSIGVPSAIGQITYAASQVVTTGFIAILGAQILSTRIYTLNILYFVMVLSISLGRGTQIIVGHMIGAGEKEKAYQEAFKSLKLSMLLTLGVTTIIFFFREQLLGLFTSNPEIIMTGAVLLVMGFMLEPGRCLNIVLGQALQAAGDAKFLMMTTIIVIWGFIVPLYYFTGIYLGYGLIGIWIIFILDEWIRGVLLWARWRSKKWESKALVGKEKQQAG
ncbi:MATE family efflux transporter [Anaerobacillus alkaliphilus]|uniref:MATE family efflux transporter n=1 Tax=Anaerobacillus alkaliphilus TaxID=1548597 RepID=A0A4Q0VWX9_9BACI|nr:MATE family efflux transporter [Anaerobacillus alkaliphilus]RXJ02088.1 MATE family efflux transporter [Anaerobacillus alkaliphilus]